MRQITITTMQSVEEIMRGQGITSPVVWVAAVHDDHTDKNHVHVLASLQGRLDKADVRRLIDVTTTACLEQRRELDRTREHSAREREEGDWELEPQLQEDRWAE